MPPLKEELYDLVSDSLYEAAWRAKLPINPALGLSSFIRALNKHEVKTAVRKDKIIFSLPEKGRITSELNTELTFDHILNGWKRFPRGSLSSLIDSTCQVHDNISDAIREKEGLSENYKKFSNQRQDFYMGVRDLLEEDIKPYFSKFQEKVFVTLSGKDSPLTSPWIFHLALRNFDMKAYKQSFERNLFGGVMSTPCVETLVEEGATPLFMALKPPSQNVMEDLFWGIYLDFFTRFNGYPLWENYKNPKKRLRYLSSRGFNGLKSLCAENYKGPLKLEKSIQLDL